MAAFLYPYKDGSASAKALAAALNIKRIKREGSSFKPQGKVVINWGSSDCPYTQARVLNDPSALQRATNKLTFFQHFGTTHPLLVPWTTDQNVVREWLQEGDIVVARTKLTGHSGEGIVLIEGAEEDIPNASLYTKYMPKKHEYRIHISTNGIFDIQRKARKTDVADENVNWKIRNLDGGFIYAREGFTLPDVVRIAAVEIFNGTGLDFGAIDIIYNEKHDRAYVLEVNTAPGLTGTTLEKYTEMLRELI
jgi:hypothetical protein